MRREADEVRGQKEGGREEWGGEGGKRGEISAGEVDQKGGGGM